MKAIKSFPETFRRQKPIGKVAIIIVGLLVLCCLCSVPIIIFSPDTNTTTSESDEVVSLAQTKVGNEQEEQVQEVESTETEQSTNTSEPTDTPKPTNTPLPPTETPDPNLITPGTYLVGTDIRPGLYLGVASGTDFLSSCYWARMEDLSGELDAIIANDNSVGQFYIEVLESDYAVKSACDLYYLGNPPNPVSDFPQKIDPGLYLVGIDIQPGTYKGQAGEDFMESCYWARLSNVRGGLDGIIANDNAVGQFYVQVGSADLALKTACKLEFVVE